MTTGPLTFEEIKRQLEGVTAARLANEQKERINAGIPVVTLKKGEIAIDLELKRLCAEDFFEVIQILKQYYKAFTELRPGIRGATLFADSVSSIERKYAERRAKDGDPGLPKPIEIDFRIDHKGGGVISFGKNTLLGQDEVNCILDIWVKLSVDASAVAATADPSTQLAELGAVVFQPNPEFNDDRLAGYAGVKQEVKETIVLPLLHPEMFREVGQLARTRPGATVPRAVLFEGPPGTGKTTMAKIIAGQSGIPLIYVPVESIMSKWFGESERRLDAIFDAAGKLERSVVFLDEIDAFAGSRDKGQIHEATRRILSVLLRQMQGLVDTSNVVVVGATNRKEDLDPALLSRFNRTVYFPLPNSDERAAIIHYYAKHLDPAAVNALSAASDGRSGRELEDACGVAERMWASELITNQSAPSAPPAESYAAAFRAKFALLSPGS
jgi:hypothetical protein